jgi:hypothetical protein
VKSVDSDDAASSDFVPSESRVSNKSSKPSLRSAIKAGTENTPEALKIVSSDLLDFNEMGHCRLAHFCAGPIYDLIEPCLRG